MINVDVTLEGDEGQVEVLKEINLTLEEKKIYVMTGPNGGGKSSIAKTIMGIYQPSGFWMGWTLPIRELRNGLVWVLVMLSKCPLVSKE